MTNQLYRTHSLRKTLRRFLQPQLDFHHAMSKNKYLIFDRIDRLQFVPNDYMIILGVK